MCSSSMIYVVGQGIICWRLFRVYISSDGYSLSSILGVLHLSYIICFRQVKMGIHLLSGCIRLYQVVVPICVVMGKKRTKTSTII